MADTLELLEKRIAGLIKTAKQLEEQKIATSTIIRNLETKAELELSLDDAIQTNQLELEAVADAIDKIKQLREQSG